MVCLVVPHSFVYSSALVYIHETDLKLLITSGYVNPKTMAQRNVPNNGLCQKAITRINVYEVCAYISA